MEMTIEAARQRVERVLTVDMVESLEAVDYELPSFSAPPRATTLADAKRGRGDYFYQLFERAPE